MRLHLRRGDTDVELTAYEIPCLTRSVLFWRAASKQAGRTLAYVCAVFGQTRKREHVCDERTHGRVEQSPLREASVMGTVAAKRAVWLLGSVQRAATLATRARLIWRTAAQRRLGYAERAPLHAAEGATTTCAFEPAARVAAVGRRVGKMYFAPTELSLSLNRLSINNSKPFVIKLGLRQVIPS